MRKCSEALKDLCAGWGAPRADSPAWKPACALGGRVLSGAVPRASLVVAGGGTWGACAHLSCVPVGKRRGRPVSVSSPHSSLPAPLRQACSRCPRSIPQLLCHPGFPAGPAPLSFHLVEPLVLPGPGFGLASLGLRAHPDGQAPGHTAGPVRRGGAGPFQGQVRRTPEPAHVFGMSGPRSGDGAHASQRLLHGRWNGSSPRHAHF